MADQTTKHRRGWLHYGCIGGLVLLLVIVIGGLLGLYYARKMFNDFTDAQPMPLPQVQMSRAEIDQVEQRLEAFRQALRTGKPTVPLTLSADEINALVANNPDFNALKDKFYVTISGNQLNGQLSMPMESAGLSIFRGRYFNGTGTFSVSLHNGRMRLSALSLIVKGKPVLEVYMDEIRKHNLAESINRQPRAAAALERLQDIRVKDGKLIIVPKEKL